MINATDDDLMALGYRRHPNNPAFNHADWLWQKRVGDERGTLYFINVYQYVGMYREHGGSDGWMPTVQLYLAPDKARHVDLTLGGFDDLLAAEGFIATAYTALGCVPDESLHELQEASAGSGEQEDA